MNMRLFLTEARRAARANLAPGLVLQAGAVSLLLIYYFVPSMRAGFEWFATQKQTYGYAYSAVATAICGGLVPFAYLLARGRLRQGVTAELLFYLVFWACMGIQVDALYRFQGVMFGTSPSVATVVRKVAFDQLVFTPLWSVPQITLCYLWKNSGFGLAALRAQITPALFSLSIPTVVVSAWLVWVPAVSIIYCLPSALQIPMFSLVLCFWSLLAEVLSATD